MFFYPCSIVKYLRRVVLPCVICGTVLSFAVALLTPLVFSDTGAWSESYEDTATNSGWRQIMRVGETWLYIELNAPRSSVDSILDRRLYHGQSARECDLAHMLPVDTITGPAIPLPGWAVKYCDYARRHEPDCLHLACVEIGWPRRMMRYAVLNDSRLAPIAVVDAPWLNPLQRQRASSPPRFVCPTNINLIATVVNALFFTFLFVALVIIITLLRNAHRVKLCVCVRCKYPRRGLPSTTCPECGCMAGGPEV